MPPRESAQKKSPLEEDCQRARKGNTDIYLYDSRGWGQSNFT